MKFDFGDECKTEDGHKVTLLEARCMGTYWSPTSLRLVGTYKDNKLEWTTDGTCLSFGPDLIGLWEEVK